MSYYRLKENWNTPESWGVGFQDPEKQYVIQLMDGDMPGNYVVLADGVSLSDVDNNSVTLTEITGDDLVKLKSYTEIPNSPPALDSIYF